MSYTSNITNVSESPVEITVYASLHGNTRERLTLAAGESRRANRITPETRALEGSGIVKIEKIVLPVPEPSALVAKAFEVDPTVDMTYETLGFAWPSIGTEPMPVDYRQNIRRFVANDKFALLRPQNKAFDVDVDWWNCHRGPHFRMKQSFQGDFIVSTDLEADGGIGEDDWAGILVVSQTNPFRFARVGIAQKTLDGVPTPVFQRVLQGDKELSDPFFSSSEVGVIEEGGPYDWNQITEAKLALSSVITRFRKDHQHRARLTVKRNGPLLYLIGDDFTETEKATLIVDNFIDGPVTVAFSIGRYPSKGSRFQGAVFHNVRGIAES